MLGRRAVALLIGLLVATAALGAQRGTQATATREALAAGDVVVGAPGKSLALSRVTIPPGVRLPLHRHPGTQVAYIEAGTLTYTVRTGLVRVTKGSPEGKHRVVRTIRAGQTGTIAAGQWIVEQPNEIHFAQNRGSSNVVVLLSTLFPIGAPPSIPVD